MLDPRRRGNDETLIYTVLAMLDPRLRGDDETFIYGLLVFCQVLELGLCATGFASAGRQYTTLMYTGNSQWHLKN